MHNVCLDAIIKHYRRRFPTELGVQLREVWVWTDNAPHQYRCRQTFIKIASVAECHPGITIRHCLAVIDNFKGFHDSVGKEPAFKNRQLELQSPPIRSPTAEKLFENLVKNIELSPEDSTWTKYEAECDYRLKNKGRFGMNSRRCWFVTEKKVDFDRLTAKHGSERILLVDRSFILDTKGHKPVDGTNNLHELRSKATAVPPGQPRVWPLTVSDLMCRCRHCKTDIHNQECQYKTWRKTHEVEMEVEKLGVGDIEACSLIGKDVARDVNDVVYYGEVESYDAAKKVWKIKFADGDTDVYDYIKLVGGMQLAEDQSN